ncbi:MAG: cheR [Phenylobacterium sp.]|nr:cheR [Phenylobacterium sp.]
MTPQDCALIAELCAGRAGLRVDPDKPYLIESRLAPLARREGFACVADLVGTLRPRAEDRLADAVAEAMAPGETGFFRDRAVLERLWRDVAPELARRRSDGVVRIWSAGCATGQEIYSLAMLQAEAPAPTGKVELFASDLSERRLERAQAGLYSNFEVQRGLAARRLVRHFETRGEHFQLAKPLRQAVRWRRVNLLDDLSALGAFDVVLCRYVLGALTPAARARVIERLAGVVAADGVLVLGCGEEAPASAGFAAHAALDGVFVREQEVRAAA